MEHSGVVNNLTNVPIILRTLYRLSFIIYEFDLHRKRLYIDTMPICLHNCRAASVLFLYIIEL